MKAIGKKRLIISFLLTVCLVFLTACGGMSNESEMNRRAVTEVKEESGKEDGGSSETSAGAALEDVNDIPEDGIISKDQFASVAGQDREIRFVGESPEGIKYTWTYPAANIQNPQDQNLKISFETQGLEDIKKEANNAHDALKMTMYGSGLICNPVLTIDLPQVWQSDVGMLLKKQDSGLTKMSDVTIVNDPDKESCSLTMKILSLEGDSYIVGGITDAGKLAELDRQAQAAAAANAGNSAAAADPGEIPQDPGQAIDNGGSDGDSEEDQSSGSSSSKKKKTSKDSASNSTDHTCTMSINCSTILNNMSSLNKEKKEFVPSNGWILKPVEVTYTPGESVHDLLQRVCRDKGIHMESQYTPAYDSAYVEGINQLYEFDCGELSGWMYSVNGWFPNYGCSKYKIADGDVICWIYTCDLGKDVGDNSQQ